MFEGLEQYQEIMNTIVEETSGDWLQMSYHQKVMIIMIMKEYKKQIDRYMANEYYKIKMWSSLDINDIALEELEPDLSRFRSNEENEFYKLMGGIN